MTFLKIHDGMKNTKRRNIFYWWVFILCPSSSNWIHPGCNL